MNARSTTLFHFTSKVRFLKTILSTGFVARYCTEDIAWLGFNEGKFAAYPMVCFCDIPLSRISTHISFYGSYGLGMTKEWALRSGLAPVLYAPRGSPVTKVVDDLFSQHSLAFNTKNVKRRTHRENLLVSALAFTKPLQGKMQRRGKQVDKDFYQESEWRYVPNVQVDRLVLQDRLAPERDALNFAAAKFPLNFNAQDVRYIFVKHESELASAHAFITKCLAARSADERAVLATRLVSLEALAADV